MSRINTFLQTAPQPRAEIAQPAVVRSTRLLSLLVVLEALRAGDVELDRQKV